MDLKSAIAYLLRDSKDMNKNVLLEILKSVFGTKDQDLQKALHEMIAKKELIQSDNSFKATARSHRRIPRLEKVKYVIPLWHRRWTVVVFHVAETEKQIRDQIRYQLRKSGFAVWQNSLWISPHTLPANLKKYIENHGVEKQVKVFYGILSSVDEAELIKTVWNTHSLEKEYQEFVKEAKRQFKRLRNMDLETELRDKALDLLAKMTEAKYLDIHRSDPKLPRPFLSKNWDGHQAYRIYQQLDKYLK
jgi:DNA-binding transcriptional regulator PaaX